MIYSDWSFDHHLTRAKHILYQYLNVTQLIHVRDVLRFLGFYLHSHNSKLSEYRHFFIRINNTYHGNNLKRKESRRFGSDINNLKKNVYSLNDKTTSLGWTLLLTIFVVCHCNHFSHYIVILKLTLCGMWAQYMCL